MNRRRELQQIYVSYVLTRAVLPTIDLLLSKFRIDDSHHMGRFLGRLWGADLL
jgi:hypothetical protein